jgi:hypothetical protein
LSNVTLENLLPLFDIELDKAWVKSLLEKLQLTLSEVLNTMVNKVYNSHDQDLSAKLTLLTDIASPPWTDRDISVFISTAAIQLISKYLIHLPITSPQVLDLKLDTDWPDDITKNSQPTNFLLGNFVAFLEATKLLTEYDSV